MLAAVDAISLNAAFWIAIGYALDRVALIGVVLIFWIVPVILEALTEGDGLLEIDFSKISHPYLLIGGFVAFDAVIPLLIVGGRFVPGTRFSGSGRRSAITRWFRSSFLPRLRGSLSRSCSS